MVANVSNRYENLKKQNKTKQNKEDGNGAYCQINNFFSKKKSFSHEQILLWFHGNWLEIYETN